MDINPHLAMRTIGGLSHVDGMHGWGMETQDQWWWAVIFDRSSSDRKKRILTRSNVKYRVNTNGKTKMQEAPDVLPRAFFVPKARGSEPLKLIKEFHGGAVNPLYD